MAVVPLINPSFEDGTLTGWTADADIAVVSGGTPYGTFQAQFDGEAGATRIVQTAKTLVAAGTIVKGSCFYAQGTASSGKNTGRVILEWYDNADLKISESLGNLISSSGGGWQASNVTATAPVGASKVAIGCLSMRTHGAVSGVDFFTWDLQEAPTVELTYPQDGVTYLPGDPVPYRVDFSVDTPVATSVTYTAEDTVTSIPTVVGTSTEAPFSLNSAILPTGNYDVTAEATYASGDVVVSNVNNLTIGEPTPPTTREFKASNAYTYMVGESFNKLASSIPATAVITGVELILDYNLQALVRSKDIGVEDPAEATYNVAFAVVTSGNFDAVLLSKDGTSYTQEGSAISENVAVERTSFVVTEDGTSEGKRWTVMQGEDQQVVLGADNALFGITSIPSTDFTDRAIGVRFYPTLGSKPDYADSGDLCFRVNIDKMRMRVYFDAGSVDYYFASPDKTQVIKGQLAAYCVDSGEFENGDAAGDLQLAPDLEVLDGTATHIDSDWTIHVQYPPTDDNQIGTVTTTSVTQAGMSYNGLPGYNAVVENRSRYVFISANFYGDESLDSIYGAHGLPRAFAYNGDFFYKICTQPDPLKDSPRHVAYHQSHLALGFKEGRVDISVAGQPYNFDGALGASSWAVGDSVVGLLPLSGAILGVFCKKSITGISGTTVDNFATQTLSPNIGAIEYTTTDMGFPVYANAYGVYTLAQVQQYGDYMGTPLSQPISPWLRPRLIRKVTSAKEVVVAWPVRSKNQYRLAFSDGYVVSMTLNNGSQQAPTFSFQKYFWDKDGAYSNPDLFTYPSIVPAAISSQLDQSGEERIHIAPYLDTITPTVVEGPTLTGAAPDGRVDTPYGPYSYTISGGYGPFQMTVVAGSLPPGITEVTDAGVITATTPTAEGIYEFTLRITDSNGLYDELEDTIVIEENLGNYWNADDSHTDLTLTNDNRTATADTEGTAYQKTRAHTAHSTGKWYFEVQGTFHPDNYDNGRVGLDHPSNDIDSAVGQGTNSYAIQSNGYRQSNGVFNPTQMTPPLPGANVIQIAWDADAGLLWYGVNGTWAFGGNPAAGTGASVTGVTGPLLPSSNMVSGDFAGNYTLSTTPAQCAYTPPTGFGRWYRY